jgi:hypothetical protein
MRSGKGQVSTLDLHAITVHRHVALIVKLPRKSFVNVMPNITDAQLNVKACGAESICHNVFVLIAIA